MSGHGAWKNVSRNARALFGSQELCVEQNRTEGRAGVLGSESFEWLHTARGRSLRSSLC